MSSFAFMNLGMNCACFKPKAGPDLAMESHQSIRAYRSGSGLQTALRFVVSQQSRLDTARWYAGKAAL